MGVRGWLADRETGNARARHGLSIQTNTNRIASQLLSSSLTCYGFWKPDNKQHGGIFNLAFSPDGLLLAAACEHRTIALIDPANFKLISKNGTSHTDCVNCVRFLDSRTFVSCSDDATVRLWDARWLRDSVRTLAAHSNWVKNVEYAPQLGLLLTSGFDGSVNAWDINSYADEEVNFRHVFRTKGLMRMKLSPDSTRMVLSTSDGYLIVIHDLHLATLAADLAGFEPDVQRRVQLGEVAPPVGVEGYEHVFVSRRNRVEFIADFPEEDDAEIIASLEVHPHGWCVVSRNSCNDNSSEWTCVHDIQGTRADAMRSASARRRRRFPSSALRPPPAPTSRLTHFAREPNVGRGFIKEMSFSGDGRLIASPFAYGVRLLAFDSACSELCDCVDGEAALVDGGGRPAAPRALEEVLWRMSHAAVVTTTRFSPTQPLLVSGCLDGSVGFHRPVL